MIVHQQDFNPLIGEVWHTCLLPPEQVKTIYQLFETRERMVIGMQWCEKAQVVKILLGHHATVTIPKSFFPDHLPLNQPWVDDWGFQICFGDFEVDLRDILFN